MFKNVAIPLACALLVAGCARHAPAPASPQTSAVTFVDAKIKDAAESISMDMAHLAGSTQNRDINTPSGPGGLYTRIDITWDGPIEGALRKIASTCGFKVRVEGAAPHTPAIVHLKLVDRPCLQALREIGMQTGAAEGIVVNEADQEIILKYISEA